VSHPVVRLGDVSSDNPTGADDQQETARPRLELDPHWVVGFVDGEGCFSVSVHRNAMVRSTGGWQLQPTFHAYQHRDHHRVLHALVRFFGCGHVRPKGPASSVLTYSVHSLQELERRVIPFFEQHPLVIKQDDFHRFTDIVSGLRRKEHLRPEGFERLVRLAYTMNAHGKQRARSLEEVLAGSSETARQALLDSPSSR
jgi:hypothetical protein